MAFYFETSAKTDINVSEAFEEVGKQVFLDMLSKKK
jgi:GTPase SAR1 family protein